MSDPLATVLARCPDAKQQANGWYQARCPAHDDRHASFGFRLDDEGAVQMKCHAGCARGEILKAMGLKTQDIYPDKPVKPAKAQRSFIPYAYRHGDGRLAYQNVRIEQDGKPKDFFVRHPDGLGGWIGTRGCKALLYDLPELLAAVKAGKRVWLCEGEKDCETLKRWGEVATTSGSASSWRKEFGVHFAGANVICLPDNDDQGRNYVDQAVSAIRQHAASVRVLAIPGLGDKEDVSDWAARGGTLEQLLSMADGLNQVGSPETSGPAKGLDSFPMTGPGNAERFEDRFGDEVRFCHTSKRWLIWDGRHWSFDQMSAVMGMARETVRALQTELPQDTEWEMRRQIEAHVKRYDSDAEYNALLRQAATMGRIRITAERFDVDPYLFTCQNGTLDLRTGELHPHDPDDLITKIAPVAYDPNATCPQWEAFLARVMGDNQALITFLQRAIGYSLTGNTRERVVFILHGTGRNGKSTLLDAVRFVLGDYGSRTPTDTILAKRDTGIPNDIARLAGCRFVTASESNQGSNLAEATVKDLTGGEPVTARFLHKEWFEFKPQFKLWLGTNHVPTVHGTDEAIWDRIRLVPFLIRIPDEEVDFDLGRKLREEAPGILAWAVRGCLDWFQKGLTHPQEVRHATQRYRADMDALLEFFEQNCRIDPQQFTQARPLYQRYCRWCELNELDPDNEKAFSAAVAERGYTKARTKGGVRWFGFSLISSENEEEEGCRVKGVKGYPENRPRNEILFEKNPQTLHTVHPTPSETPEWPSLEGVDTLFGAETSLGTNNESDEDDYPFA